MALTKMQRESESTMYIAIQKNRALMHRSEAGQVRPRHAHGHLSAEAARNVGKREKRKERKEKESTFVTKYSFRTYWPLDLLGRFAGRCLRRVGGRHRRVEIGRARVGGRLAHVPPHERRRVRDVLRVGDADARGLPAASLLAHLIIARIKVLALSLEERQ